MTIIKDDPSPQGVRRTYREALARARDQATVEYLTELLVQHEGNVTSAAQDAGIKRESLHRLMRRHGLTGIGRPDHQEGAGG